MDYRLVFPLRAPRCWSIVADWVEWKRLAQLSLERRLRKPTYCIDCTPEFQKKMIEAGRCEHHRVKFVPKFHKTAGVTTYEGVRLDDDESA